ncbi:uncharacterized protein LOC118800062 isoform X2 [Colossoma macropomum]|uniref:uncharacterized protein LOC118800062 isoform X2 n=1 Tax=Colossoma macropomum TaxID=42526 RepID=UPI001864EF38|nr:uncharacterized protein LOC118800062 isoform X2 [Colossoma macropomum]
MALFILISFHLILQVQLQNVPQPELSVSPAVLTQRGSVQLDCKTLYAGVSQCYFYPERDKTNLKHSPSCQLSLTGSELTRWTGRSYRSPQSVNITCYYTVDEFRTQAESPHSLPAPVTVLVLDKKPTVTVSHDDQRHEFTLVCEISLSLSADVGCDFYIGDEKLRWLMSQRTRSGSLACSLTLHKDFLFSRMKSAKSREVSCDYSLNSDQTVHSPLSDSYSLTQLPPLPTPETTTQSKRQKSTTTAPYDVITLHGQTTIASLTTYSNYNQHIQKVPEGTDLVTMLSASVVGVLLAEVMLICLCRFIRKKKTGSLCRVAECLTEDNDETVYTAVIYSLSTQEQ